MSFYYSLISRFKGTVSNNLNWMVSQDKANIFSYYFFGLWVMLGLPFIKYNTSILPTPQI